MLKIVLSAFMLPLLLLVGLRDGGSSNAPNAAETSLAKHGESGLWISDLFPELAKHADDLCLVNGMHTDLPSHPQAFLQMHCGIFQFPRPR